MQFYKDIWILSYVKQRDEQDYILFTKYILLKEIN